MIPTFDQLMRPILVLAAQGKISRVAMTQAMVKEYRLSEEEANKRIPSGGSTYIGNRVGWAMTFLTKAGLISKIAYKTYSATDLGKQFLASHPKKFALSELEKVPGWEDAWEAGRAKRRERKKGAETAEATATPTEIIAEGVQALREELRCRLLDTILKQTPGFFEKLVLDVLAAMGYGGGLPDAFKHEGKSGDEGVDGRINQDALGLDQICVQAKRYAPDRAVDRKSIQAFVGSLAGQGVTKGIFITTSHFAGTAEEFVTRGSPTKVVLVDGEKLIELMLRHRIGTRVQETHEIFEIDQNYFDEE